MFPYQWPRGIIQEEGIGNKWQTKQGRRDFEGVVKCKDTLKRDDQECLTLPKVPQEHGNPPNARVPVHCENGILARRVSLDSRLASPESRSAFRYRLRGRYTRLSENLSPTKPRSGGKGLPKGTLV